MKENKIIITGGGGFVRKILFFLKTNLEKILFRLINPWIIYGRARYYRFN